MATGNAINANGTGLATYDGSGTWVGRSVAAGSGISVTNGSGVAGNPTIAVTTGGLTWTDAVGATQALATNNGYVTDHAVAVAYTLPASGNLGDVIWIVGKLGSWSVAQNANQQILVGSSSSTIGVGGSIASTNVGDSVVLVCVTAGASTVWRAASVVGNLTIV